MIDISKEIDEVYTSIVLDLLKNPRLIDTKFYDKELVQIITYNERGLMLSQLQDLLKKMKNDSGLKELMYSRIKYLEETLSKSCPELYKILCNYLVTSSKAPNFEGYDQYKDLLQSFVINQDINCSKNIIISALERYNSSYISDNYDAIVNELKSLRFSEPERLLSQAGIYDPKYIKQANKTGVGIGPAPK